MARVLLWILSACVVGCSPSDAEPTPCPAGTYADEGECVPDGTAPELDAEPSDTPHGDDDDHASDPEAGGWDESTAELPTLGDDGNSGPDPSDGPSDRPDFPDRIGRLSFAVKTAGGRNDGSDGQFEVCLRDDRCFRLDVPAVDDFRSGEFDVYHFAGVDMPRSRVDRVEIRHVNGSDMWRPACIETRFDGEPVQCNADLPPIGTGGGAERRRHRMTLTNDCNTCYPARITHGPLVGAVTADEARILLRSDATRPLKLQIVKASAPGRVVSEVGPRWPNPGDDYTTTFRVRGLEPRTEYVAKVLIGDFVTAFRARFRTAPRPAGSSRFQVALGSCTNNHNVRPVHPIFDVIRERDPEIFIFLGDNHYGNTGNTQALWWNYRDTLGMPPRERLVGRTSTLAIWDDHDFTGNNTNRHAAGRDRALRAFKDYWANASYGTSDTPGIFSKVSHGDVDFFLLDTRYHRDRPGTGGSILGDEQLSWLRQELRASNAVFKILASGSLFSRSGGETWTDYATRRQLFRFIRDQDIRGVVFLAGDIHRSSLRRIRRSDGYDIPEVVASGLANRRNSSCRRAPADYRQIACVGETGSFAMLDIDTTRRDPRIVARLFDERGTRRGEAMTILRSQLR